MTSRATTSPRSLRAPRVLRVLRPPRVLRVLRTVGAIVVLAAGLAACGGSTGVGGIDDGGDGDGDGEEATDTPLGAWELSSADPTITVPDGARVTLTVQDDDGQLRAGGTAACNSYGGTLTIDGASWSLAELAQTEMGCEPPFMEAEQAYLGALAGVDTWSRDGDTLELTGGGAVLSFQLLPEVEPASFTGTTWEVDGYVQGSGDEGAVSSGTVGVEPATLRLDEGGSFELFTGCRDFAGEWTTSGDEVMFPSWGQTEDSRGVGDDGGLTCGDQAEAQEQAVLAVVEGGFTATVDGQRLTLMNGDVGLSLRATE